ncbi:MAG: flippase-like domain-containing protein [Candidatus Cloacimonetes bacterium]|nr:flippase-like domain-containing protein [Candidatus Cloacimonadota bacterium]
MKHKHLRILLSVLFGLICLAVWVHITDMNELLDYIRQVHIGLAALAAVAYIVSYILRSLRWTTIMSTVHRVSPLPMFAYYMAGNFFNYLVPIRAGELAKCYFVKQRYGVRVSRSLPTIFIDKLFDSAAIFLVLLLIPLLPINLNKPLWILIIFIVGVVLAGIGVLIAASLAREQTTRLLQKLLFFVPKKYSERLQDISSLFVEGIGLFRHHHALLPQIAGLTLLAVLSDSMMILFLFWSFGVSVNYFMVLFGYTLIYLSYILPHPPAQIGSNELLMVLIFSVGFGLDRNLVSAVMAFGHLITGVLIVSIGLSAVSWTGTGIFRTKFDVDNGDENETG